MILLKSCDSQNLSNRGFVNIQQYPMLLELHFSLVITKRKGKRRKSCPPCWMFDAREKINLKSFPFDIY